MAMRTCPVHGQVVAVKHWVGRSKHWMPFVCGGGHWGQWLCPECGKYAKQSKRPSEGLRHQTFTDGGK
jgi:hypothetical protein